MSDSTNQENKESKNSTISPNSENSTTSTNSENSTESKQDCHIIKRKFNELKTSIAERAHVGLTLFSTSIIISALITILFIPKVYSKITQLVPNLYYRLFVIFIFFVAIVYIIERIIFNIEFPNINL